MSKRRRKKKKWRKKTRKEEGENSKKRGRYIDFNGRRIIFGFFIEDKYDNNCPQRLRKNCEAER